MSAFQFKTLTTETFLDFLRAELPEVFDKVDVDAWIYKPGMPEKKHPLPSKLFDETVQALREYEKGKRPAREQVQGWRRIQILTFLSDLPKRISVEDCKYFEQIFDLEKRNDGAFFSAFYAVCIDSGYKEILPRVEKYMETIGRRLYILPVVRALIRADWTRPQVRALVDRVRAKHHPVTVQSMETLLKMAGL